MIALLLKLYVLKHLARLITGTSEKAQSVDPPPFVHTGYRPATTTLLVKLNPHIEGLLILLPRTRRWPLGSGKPVMWLIVILLSTFAFQVFDTFNRVPPPVYRAALMSSTVTSWML